MSSESVNRDTVESYPWGAGCLGWHLVRTDALSIIHEEMPPGTEEIRHRHLRARQFFFVLGGTLILECDGVRHELAPHNGLDVPPMMTHQARNESGSAVEFLVISQPPSHGDREAADG